MSDNTQLFINITEKIAQSIAFNKSQRLTESLKIQQTSFNMATVFNQEITHLVNGHTLKNVLGNQIDYFSDDSLMLTTVTQLDETVFNSLKKIMKQLNTKQLLERTIVNYTYKSIKKRMTTFIIMPIKSTVLIGNVSVVVIFPVTFLINKNLDHIIKPIFKKGKYETYLHKIHFYHDEILFIKDLVKMCRLHYQTLEHVLNEVYIETTKLDLTKKKTKDLIKNLTI